MTGLQIINKIVKTNDLALLTEYGLGQEYFPGYENEFEFIEKHYQQYGNIPNFETFLDKFPEVPSIDVTETNDYLISAIREEHLYWQTVPIIQKAADMLKEDANEAAAYLLDEISKLDSSYEISGVDIAKNALERFDVFMHPEEVLSNFIPTGFKELDEVFTGFQKGEEFVVIFARTGQGKSWTLAKMISHAWRCGYRAGYVSPEMSATKIGYRIDTVTSNFSNSGLVRANHSKVSPEEYQKYAEEMATKEGLIVATKPDFNYIITVQKLKAFVKQHNLEILGIDGLSYLTDQRQKRGDNKSASLTNIAEDLFNLSIDLGIPVLGVVQSNRQGANEDGAPDIENIRDSDGIAYNATKIISLRQDGKELLMEIKKNRDEASGRKLKYEWDIDKGDWKYTDSKREATFSKRQTREQKEESPSTFSAGNPEVRF